MNLLEPLADAAAAIQRLRYRTDTERLAETASDQLPRLRHLIDLMELEFAVVAARFAASGEHEQWGCVSPIQWIRQECRTSGHVAATAVDVGQQLDRLPETRAALEAGDIGFGHLALIARTSQALAHSPSAGDWDEKRLLKRAKRETVSRFRHECSHIRHEADSRAYLEEHIEAISARKLELLPCESGALSLRGFFDAEAGATLRTALEPLARRSGLGDDRRHERRLADALLELAAHGLDAGLVPQRAGVRPHLQVTVALETLQGLAGAPAGDVQLSDPLPGETARRFSCDATVRRIVLDSASTVVDVGRAQRVPGAAVRRALAARDGGCVWPGCDHPVSWTAAHHLRHWAKGGDTNLENLALLCHRHHWMAHEGGWELHKSGSGELIALPPVERYLPARARPPGASAA